MAKKKASETPISIEDAQRSLANSNASEEAKQKALTPQQLAARERKRESNRKSRAKNKAASEEEKLRRVLSRLPERATPAAELNWIRVHPAMTRQTRTGQPVIITVEDITKPPQGKAPSQSAVNQLQHWANHAKEFFKQVIGEDRKKLFSVDEDEDEGAVADENLPKEIKNIDEMLMALEGAVQFDA